MSRLTRAQIRTPQLIKISRPGFWVTSMWFYLLPLGGREVFGDASFWLGLLYVGFPLGLLIYGWNDFVDRDTDRLNPRKGTYLFGARATDAELRRLPFWIAAVQAPFFVAFVWLIGAKALLLLAGLLAFTWLYNARPWGFKNYPVLDLTNQIGYLLVFVLSSWLNGAPQVPWATFVFGALFAMHSHLLGAMMDIEPDRAAGRRTTANTIGRVNAKWLIAVFLGIECLLVYRCFDIPLIAAGLAAGALYFLADALTLWRERPYSEPYAAAFLLLWNGAALLSAPWIWHTAAFASVNLR
ncbi:MAG: UbiA family prenyltransferase [Candidatus Hydrogenedentes bacterium]|nr:UbiA family prenyltransferase [Candidatus Hydrogenedentota bacterium]